VIKPGIDVLLERGLGDLRGAALGLLTGAGGVTSALVPTLTALRTHPDARLVALFGAEHGVRGDAAAGEHVPSGRDAATGLPVHSLYGETREPTDAMLAGLEAIVVDLQDVGLRYYTYPSTVLALLRAAAVRGLAVVVLDRPNPLTGTILEGPVAEPAFRSFIGAALVPIRHGLTLGELAHWMNARDGIGADLRGVAMDGWRRGMWFDEGGLPWVPPSPNIPSLVACVAYTATCLIEGTTISEGRGTTQPFEVIGAPWVDADTLAARLNDLTLPGVRFRPTWFRPATSKHAGQTCGGVQLHIVDRLAFAGVRTGLHLLATLRSLYSEQVTWVRGASGSYFIDLLLGTDAPRRAIERGDDVDVVVALWQSAIEVFKAERRPFLLYEE
jgi:uncharacterized protein YbbC (DUF1343 family)